ncbi:hypothetical protein Goklo_022912 [Gossypium klotzschianum]|uniref:Uncharacterized protein n=1 Tax=Gossypium klotzschianum TaxID=34286 RepID=A0A7J8TP03_9ROSI|nr:hypothetical protein [Gossypium klotzschianum]
MKDCRQLKWLRPLTVGLNNTNHILVAAKGIIPGQIQQITRMIHGFFYPLMELRLEIPDTLLQEVWLGIMMEIG